jgi:hypothetical protein
VQRINAFLRRGVNVDSARLIYKPLRNYVKQQMINCLKLFSLIMNMYYINFFLLSVMLLIVITFVNKLMTVSYLINATA